MSRLQIELAHLVNLMAPPFRENFKAFCWDKALRLAETDAEEFAELPALLKAAMQSDSNGSTRIRPSTDK